MYENYNFNDFDYFEAAKYHYFADRDSNSYLSRIWYIASQNLLDVFSVVGRLFLIPFGIILQPIIIAQFIYLRFIDPTHTG